jgi:predicted ArsR family transcriptional regulator
MTYETEKGNYPSEIMILMSLKNNDGQSLNDLSKAIGISRMAVLKHLQVLEKRGVVERRIVKKNVGRPYFRFYLLRDSSYALGSSGDILLDSLLAYMEETGRREVILEFLKKRYSEVEAYYRSKLSGRIGKERIEALARLRQLENYFPELRKTQGSKYELLEFNCPVYSISKKFSEACDLERRLFQNVLKMRVDTTHTQINGHGTCRFLIDKDIR